MEPYKTVLPTDLDAENVVRNRTKYISVRIRIRKSYFVTVSEDFRMATGSKLLFLPHTEALLSLTCRISSPALG